MEDRVVRILPALINQSTLVLAMIFDKTIAIRVTMGIHPIKCGLDMRPQLPHRFEIAGTLEVFASQQNEERSSVDTAVITCERHLAQLCHLAGAHLMQDFARLSIALGIELRGLGSGEKTQDTPRYRRIDPQCEQGGQKAC